MKKATLFILCAALLIGSASYLLLVAQVPVIQPINVLPPGVPQIVPVPQPMPPGPFDPRIERVPVPEPPRPIAHVGKFRIAIEYKLKNITPQSLSDFLEEQGQFNDLELVIDDDADTIMIKVSLDDHKIIQQMLVDIEREVEMLRDNAAGGERLIKSFNLNPPYGTFMPILQSHCPRAIFCLDDTKGLLIVSASESDMKKVEQFLEQLMSSQKATLTVDTISPFEGIVRRPQ